MTDTNAAREGAFNAAVLAASLIGEHAADIVEILNKLPPPDAAEVVRLLPRETAVEILDKPELDFGAEIIEALPRHVAAPLLAGMSADVAADIVRQLEEPAKTELLGKLDDVSRGAINGLLAYPENTAGSIMTTEFVSVPSNWTVEQTLAYIRQVERTRETIYAIYVLDQVTRRLAGAVSLRRLISGDPPANIMSLASKPITTFPLVDREDVARLIARHDLLAVPVIDKAGHLLGIVTFDDIIDTIIEENTEDVQKFGGMEAIDRGALPADRHGRHAAQTRSLARGSVRQRNAYRQRHAAFRGRVAEGAGANAVHSADHEFRRQFGLAGNLAPDPRAGAARREAVGLVAGDAARIADRAAARRGPWAHRTGPGGDVAEAWYL